MRENDIRPAELWEQYKLLCDRDAVEIFQDCKVTNILCPACQSGSAKETFRKNNFTYQNCDRCGTIFLNPRPLAHYFKRFYTEGKSVKFWSTDFYPAVKEQRKKEIYAPRVDIIKKRLIKKGYNLPLSVVDIGSGYGSFLEEIRQQALSEAPEGIEPNRHLAKICREKGFYVYESTLEDVSAIKNRYDIAVAFEVLEHLYDPRDFVGKAYKLLKPGGILLMTSLSGTGYDFQMLGKDHDNLKPPHHINFFNPGSAKIFFSACGFSKIEVETPGKLDVDILCNRVKDFPYLLNDKLFSTLYHGQQELKDSYQAFLVKNKLSSHMWIWAEKSDNV